MIRNYQELSTEPCLMYRNTLKQCPVELNKDICRQIMRSAGIIDDYCEIVKVQNSKKKKVTRLENTRSSSLDQKSKGKPTPQKTLQSQEESYPEEPKVKFVSKKIAKLRKKSFFVKSISKKSKIFLIEKIRKFFLREKLVNFVSQEMKTQDKCNRILRGVGTLKEKSKYQSWEFKSSIFKIEKDLGMIEKYLGNVPTKAD